MRQPDDALETTLDDVLETLSEMAEALRILREDWEMIPLDNATIDQLELTLSRTIGDIKRRAEYIYFQMIRRMARG